MTKNYCYSWSGINDQHKKISGEQFAMSINFAKLDLLQRNIKLIYIRKKRRHFFPSISKKITTQDLAVFFRQLATLISAGIPIVQCCESLKHSQEKPLLKKIITTVQHDIEAGHGFTQSLRNFPGYFNDLTCQLLEAGEQSGTLEAMLNRVAFHHEKMLRLKRQIIQALLYPGIISTIAFTVTLIMLIFIVPRFQDLFANTHTPLPTFTRSIIFISDLLRNNAWLTVFPILGISLSTYFVKTSIQGRVVFDSLVLKIPYLCDLIQKTILTRFARSLATLFAAGIPITDALKMTAKISGNYHYTQAILTAHSVVTSGQHLYTAMQQNSLFPTLVIQMTKIGEEAGSLDKMLEKIADFYEAEVDHFVSQLSQLLEPLIMVVLGVLIGGLVIAMYLPIFKLGTII